MIKQFVYKERIYKQILNNIYSMDYVVSFMSLKSIV